MVGAVGVDTGLNGTKEVRTRGQLREREKEEELALTVHFTPKPPINPFLQPFAKQTSPLSFLILRASFSLPTSSFFSVHFLLLMCRSMVSLGSSPSGVPIGREQRGQGMGVRSGGGEVQG